MQNKPTERTEKKVYEPPALVVYGTVWKLTQQVGVHGSFDGGRRSRNIKTRP